MKNLIQLLVIIVLVSSCSPTLKLLTGVRNPKIRSDVKADAFLERLPDTANVYDAHFTKMDKEIDVVLNLFKGMASSAHVYDENQNLLCYQGDNFCGAVVLIESQKNSVEDVYQLCTEEETDPLSAPMKLQDLYANLSFETNAPAKARYTVVFFWSYDLARRDHEDNWLEVYESFQDKEDVVFLRVNTDLRSSWDLPEGKKGKVKFKREGDEIDMSVVVPFYEKSWGK